MTRLASDGLANAAGAQGMSGLRAVPGDPRAGARNDRTVRALPDELARATAHPLDHSIALTAAALVLLVIMCTTTLMSVQTAGIMLSAGLFSGPEELVHRGMVGLAVVVVFVTVVAPFGKLIGTLYVLIRLHEATPPRHLRRVFVLAEQIAPLVDDRGVRLRRVRRLRETWRCRADRARHRRLCAAGPHLRHHLGRQRAGSPGDMGQARSKGRAPTTTTRVAS